MLGFKIVIIIGRVTKKPINVAEIKTEETTIGIGLMNAPIIPLAKSNGMKAQ
ncbi:unnamed protein product, partial [marine sediment metagenome]